MIGYELGHQLADLGEPDRFWPVLVRGAGGWAEVVDITLDEDRIVLVLAPFDG